MRFIVALALAGCASTTEHSKLASNVTREGTGAETTWVFAVTNHNAKTVKLAGLEWTDDKGEFKSVGGMADIAHSCRQGTTTITSRDTVEFERKQKDKPKLRLTYVLDGSDTKWTQVIE